jgi:hypothetical protein
MTLMECYFMLHNLEKLAGDVNKFQVYLCTFTHAIHNQAARCVAAECGIFKNLL